MAILGMILAGIGGIIAFVGGIWLLVKAFQENIWWGIGSLIISPVLLVFAIMHWSEAAKPFLIYLAGVGILIVGAVLIAMGAPATDPSLYSTPALSP